VNLGYGEETRIDALAGLVSATVGRADLKPRREAERPGDVPRLWVDCEKLRRATGWRPRTTPASGLAATVAYYRELYAADPACLARMQTLNWES
jgi:UDP-glucose 4-epimerase